MQEWVGSGTDQQSDRQGRRQVAKQVVLIHGFATSRASEGGVDSPWCGNDAASLARQCRSRCLAFGLAFRCKLDARLAFVEMNEAIDVRVGTLVVEGSLENLTHEIADGHR